MMKGVTLEHLNMETTQHIADWFTEAKPSVTNKDVNTQIGCHFEEVAEMLDAMEAPDDLDIEVLIKEASMALETLGTALKQSNTVLKIDRVNFVDALADQVVTAIGSGTYLGMNVPGAIEEVNLSNWSKFDDNNKAILDANGKIMKSQNYFKAKLEQFV